MLPYFRNYAFVAYVLGVAVPVGLITASSWVFGFYVVYTLPGLIAAIVLLAACLLASKRIVTRMADRKADEYLSLYNDGCDPQAFLDAARNVAAAIRPPYEENGSWFLSFYALALDDAGQREEAARIGQAMLSSAQMARDPQQRAGLLVNIEPLIERLFGVDAALEVIAQAEEAVTASDSPDDGPRRDFLRSERALMEAIRNGDAATLTARFSAVRTNAAYPMRVRVSDALMEASVHKSRGDAAAERACLEFVVANGNKLPAVGLAQERLAAL